MFFVSFHWKKAILNSLFLVTSFIATSGFTILVKAMSLRLRPNNQPELADIIRVLHPPPPITVFFQAMHQAPL